MIELKECGQCKYVGTISGEVCCDFLYLTGRSRRSLPKREDGKCPAFDRGERPSLNPIPLPHSGKPRKQRNLKFPDEKMMAMYLDGATDREISEELKCARSTVRRFRNRNGLPFNTLKNQEE